MDFTSIREKAGLSIDDVSSLTGYNARTVYRWENGSSSPRKAVLDLISRIAQSNETNSWRIDKSDFTFIDLFAGIGGIRKGFEGAGGKCVFTSEWDKYARQTYHANFGCDHPIAGDITKVDEVDIPAHDVLLAGFPCQPFSIAGVSKKNSLGRLHGFEDKTQGTLFFDVARIIAHHRPAAFLLENVKNLGSHDKGKTFKVIRETLWELGYHISVRIIDAKGYVPQHRERIYIAGFREDYGFDLEYMHIKSREDGPPMSSILHPQDGSELPENPYTLGENAIVNSKYTLSTKLWSYLKKYAAKHKAKGNGFGYGLVGPNDTSRTLSARYYKDGSEILIDQDNLERPRRLTPRECARLMGFDAPGNSSFVIPVSDTQSYKQFGNSVVVPVISEIAKAMKPYVLKVIQKESQTSKLQSAR